MFRKLSHLQKQNILDSEAYVQISTLCELNANIVKLRFFYLLIFRFNIFASIIVM